ncbi:unnamed protein product [Brassica napus]|uniref:non-specific serine/threonine protein kinase n=1 Tax=Brassica napus TaxID=3708 RepID=A0A816WUK3_BRANA|nr:unnamed protein product [Brassica napus]
MWYLPTSCLVFFFLFSLLHHLSCASTKKELGWCEAIFECGNITAGFPFSGGSRPQFCGHPSLELHCFNNKTSIIISDHLYDVLHIDQISKTIKLAKAELRGSFCTATFTTTTLPPEIFELSTTSQSLTVFYLCHRNLRYNSSYLCPDRGSISVSQNLNYHKSCQDSFKINVPKSYVPEEKELNLKHLENALHEGFDVKVKIDEQTCEQCLSSQGICGFNNTTQICCKNDSSSRCNTLHIPRSMFLIHHHRTGSACGLVGVILIALVLFCLFIWRRKTSDVPRQLNLKALMPLEHYSYAQVKRITKSFSEVVGKGGFGIVYRGTLCDGRKVAVKVLNDTTGNGEDFVNEVASMSKTSHVNIVTLLGFCAEGTKRAILYEFLENGSLDKFISSKRSSNMDWMELYGIALGVARGLEYLHHGCRTRIVHFDIKPQNVLLDGNLCPKVSDFGLAKLCERKESILSLLDTRGTIGYIAPEVFSRVYGRVSHKSDVYSYGMLVLEMIGARTKTSSEDTASSTSSVYFPEWIYKDLEKGHSGTPTGNGISNEEEEIAKKMALVGLWCVQYSPSDRPPMNRVVEMMEGSLEALEVPPRPVLQIATAPLPESSSVSEDISVYTEVC